MKPSNQLIVGLVFLILAAAGIALVNREIIKPASTPTPTQRPNLLEGVLATDITAVSIVDNATGAAFKAEQGDDLQWQILEGDKTQDMGLGVDQVRLASAIAVLPNMTPSTSFEADDLAPFGLDKPAYTLTLTVKGGELILEIGAENPDKTDRYVLMSDSSEIFLIGSYNLQPFITFLTDPPYVKPTEDIFAALTASPTATTAATETPAPSATPTPKTTQTPTP